MKKTRDKMFHKAEKLDKQYRDSLNPFAIEGDKPIEDTNYKPYDSIMSSIGERVENNKLLNIL